MTPPGVSNSLARKVKKTEELILFVVGKHRLGIAASAVQEIRCTDGLAGVSTELAQTHVPKVRHTLRRGNLTYYVVNSSSHFHLPPANPALVLVLRDWRVAVLIDSIESMATISRLYALPLAFTGEERQWYRGLALIADRVVPVIAPSGFLGEKELLSLDDFVANVDNGHPKLEGSVAG